MGLSGISALPAECIGPSAPKDGASGSQALSSKLICLVAGFPLLLQGREEVGAAVGAEEFVVFDHGGGADARRRKRMFDADDAGGEADADGIGQGQRAEGRSG